MNKTSDGMTKYSMSHDMLIISLSVLPSYFIKKNTRNEVKGRDFNNAAPTGVFSDN